MKTGKRNIWKLVALIFIALFCIVIIGGLVRFNHFKSAFTPATPEQIEFATTLVSHELEARGDSIEKYQVKVAPKTTHMDNKVVIRVDLSNETTREFFLINLDEQKVKVHSTTVFYDGMMKPEKQRAWFHGRR